MIKTKNGGLKMGCQDKDLQLKVVVDDAFENSYWTFDVREAIKQASQKFREQFGVGFNISSTTKWDSVGMFDLVDYPDNVIKRIPKLATPEEILDAILRLSKVQLPIIIDYEKEKVRFCKYLGGNPSRAYQAGFLAGWLDYQREKCLLRDLRAQFPPDNVDIIIGFTGKKIRIEPGQDMVGISDREKYALVYICHDHFDVVIIHEMAHCLGAVHCSDEENSIMRSSMGGVVVYDFDSSNKAIILKSLQDRFGCK